MEVICYSEISLSLNYCPFKENINKYRVKLIANIKSKIEIIAQKNGIPQGGFSKKLTGFDGFEIKQRKDNKIVIRIIYFLYQDKMVLLNVFEKPADYDTSKERRKIDKQVEFAKKYIEKFKLNPKLYEKF